MLPSIIHTSQTCAVKGRVIQENLIADTIFYANTTNFSLGFVGVDQEKAFDRMEWNYLDRCLQRYNFGNTMRRWTKIIYTNICSKILVNGWISNPIQIQRGARQGCPLSMILYVSSADPFAKSIQHNSNIQGITLPSMQEPAKLTQHADDTNIIIRDEAELPDILQILDLYGKASGAKVNIAKCNGIWCGQWKTRTDDIGNFQWNNKSIKTLGMEIYNKRTTTKISTKHTVNT